MEVKTNKISDCQLELTIEVPYERYEKIMEGKYEKVRKSIKMNGFRTGKVPMGMIKRMYGQSIEAEAREDAVRQFYVEAVDQAGIAAIAPGDIKDLDFGKGKPFTFKAVVEIMPDTEIKDLDDLKTFLEEVSIKDDDVEAGLEVLREEHAVITPSDDPVNASSVVIADVHEVDPTGVPLLTHNWKDVTIDIGKNAFGPEVDEQLMNLNKEEQVIVSFKNEDERNKSGEDKYYLFDIKDIKAKNIPEVDEEFAKSINPEYDSVEKLRIGIKDYITRQSNSRAKVKMLNRLVEYLIENNRIDVPPSMLSSYLDRLLENARNKGEKIEEEEFRKRYEPSAIRNLKWYIMRKNLIEKQGLQASIEEVDAEIETAIEESGGDKDTLKEYFTDEKNREKVTDDIEERKVLEFLESKAKITTRKTDYKDFIQDNA